MDEQQFRLSLKIDVTVLELWVDQGWVIPETTGDGRLFHDADLARGRLILDLVQGMGINEAGVDVVMDLIDQVHGLRHTLRDLVDAIDTQDEIVKHRIVAAGRRKA
jgi:chaperone modulatory protein CbpM